MTSSKLSDPTRPDYYPLPSDREPQYVVVIPDPYPLLRRACRCYACYAAVILLVAAAIYLLYPSDPKVSVDRLRLHHLKIHTFPKISLDVTLDVTARVRNIDFYSVNFRSVVVAIGYRGKQLGYVTSDYGHVKARASSYINATLELSDVKIFADVIPLITDLAKGSIRFDTVTEIGGELGFFLFDIPLKGKVLCEIVVDTRNETISHQNCYPESLGS